MKTIVFAILITALVGCSTKNYGRQGEVTSFERQNLTCREIVIEQAKVHGYLSQVESESEFDARSVLSFLGDFGIGNVMEKNAALKAANTRLAQLQDLSGERQCLMASGDQPVNSNPEQISSAAKVR